MSKGSRGGNAQRSNAYNPNNAAHKASADNRSNQLNPNNERYQGDEGDE